MTTSEDTRVDKSEKPLTRESLASTEGGQEQMMRTANLTASISRDAGGLFEGVRRLVQSLHDKGVEGQVFGVQDRFTQTDLEAWQPVDACAFKPTWPKSFGYSPRFLEELLTYDPELIHTHGLWVYPSVAANTFSRSRLCPYLVSAHGMLDSWAVQNSRWKKAIAYFLYEGAHLRGARCLRALCEAEARSFRKLGLKNDIAIIPNGIDLPKWPSPARPPWRDVIEPGRKVLLFLSRVHPKKGLVNLLRAWADVCKPESKIGESTDWVLAIAGWDQEGHERELKRLATELNIRWKDVRDRKVDGNGTFCVKGGLLSVVFLGPRFGADKSACYHSCDAFILPSFSEGVPMVVLEAWANSKPVLMTPQCNLPVGFSAGAALQVEPTSESIGEGLRRLFRMSETERTSMSVRACSLAAERFIWARIAEDMKEVYRWMLGGGSKPGCMADF
jgi:poly(glycerol-phosphate) alpha-glucosyltransferase